MCVYLPARVVSRIVRTPAVQLRSRLVTKRLQAATLPRSAVKDKVRPAALFDRQAHAAVNDDVSRASVNARALVTCPRCHVIKHVSNSVDARRLRA